MWAARTARCACLSTSTSARPDSIIEGQSVHEARKQAGRFLAQEHPVEADVVIGVPDSGLDAALGYSEESGIPYGIGFIKNKYIGRTFIQRSQKQRENSVRIKLNAVSSTVKGKRVVLVDDSIVRGTTSARIIKLLRDAGRQGGPLPRLGAAVHHIPAISARTSPDQKLLVATGRTVDEINEIIGADSLGYLSTEHVVKLAANAHCGFCTACFTGEYAVKPKEVLSTDIHERHLNDRPKDEKKSRRVTNGKELFGKLCSRRCGYHRRLPLGGADETARRPHHDHGRCIGGHGRLRRPV